MIDAPRAQGTLESHELAAADILRAPVVAHADSDTCGVCTAATSDDGDVSYQC